MGGGDAATEKHELTLEMWRGKGVVRVDMHATRPRQKGAVVTKVVCILQVGAKGPSGVLLV